MNGYQLQQKLMAHKILIRVCDNFYFLDAFYVRFAVREAADILKLETSLRCLFSKKTCQVYITI